METKQSIEFKLNQLDTLAIDKPVTSTEAITTTGALTATNTANVIVIPTSDPGVAGAIWNNLGTLTVSVG